MEVLSKIETGEAPKKLTKEERLRIEEQIFSLEMKQYAIKIIINSIYGAFGNKFFYFHNNDIAQSITIQGQDLIKFSIKAINHYFINKWHLDTELHEALGVTGKKINQITEEASIYADTDSTYVNFQLIFDSIENFDISTDDKILFCEKIIKHTFAQYLDKAFAKYAVSYGTENRMNFKLENISSSGIWVAKKSYVLRVKFEKYLMKNGELLAKGIDYAKPTFPKWARNKMEIFINMFLDKGRTVFHEEDIIPLLVQFKKEMRLCDVDDIAFNYNVTKYNQYIESVNPLIIKKGTPIRARAAAYHNTLIEQTGIHKYARVRQGNKIKFYFAKYPPHQNDTPEIIARKKEMNVYGYIGGDYPLDFAIPIDYDQHFQMVLVEPINKLLKAMGMNTIGINLRRNIKIVYTKSKKRSFTMDEMLPLYAINTVTLDYVEIPNKYAKYILDSDKPLPKDETVLRDYVSYITRYSNDTAITVCTERDKFITAKKKIAAKKKYIENLTNLPPSVYDMLMMGINELKEYGFKHSIDIETGAPLFTRNKTKKAYILSFNNILKIQKQEQYLGIMKLIFADELAGEKEVLVRKEAAAQKKIKKQSELTAQIEADEYSDDVKEIERNNLINEFDNEIADDDVEDTSHEEKEIDHIE